MINNQNVTLSALNCLLTTIEASKRGNEARSTRINNKKEIVKTMREVMKKHTNSGRNT